MVLDCWIYTFKVIQMLTIDKNILALIKLKYSGEVLTAMLEAWDENPTYKSDCTVKRLEKEYERRKYVKEKLGIQVLN